MSEPAQSAVAPPSKGAVFLRRLLSFTVLWGIVLGSLFSGNKVVSDFVFLLILGFLAAAGLQEFYGMVAKLGHACYAKAGIFGGVLLLAATFCYISVNLAQPLRPRGSMILRRVFLFCSFWDCASGNLSRAIPPRGSSPFPPRSWVSCTCRGC